MQKHGRMSLAWLTGGLVVLTAAVTLKSAGGSDGFRPMVVTVPPSAQAAAYAVSDTLFHYHGARVEHLALIGDALLVELAPGQYAPAVRRNPSGPGCVSEPYPTPALRNVARRAWQMFGREHGARQVHVAVGSANEVRLSWTTRCGDRDGLPWVTFRDSELAGTPE